MVVQSLECTVCSVLHLCGPLVDRAGSVWWWNFCTQEQLADADLPKCRECDALMPKIDLDVFHYRGDSAVQETSQHYAALKTEEEAFVHCWWNFGLSFLVLFVRVRVCENTQKDCDVIILCHHMTTSTLTAAYTMGRLRPLHMLGCSDSRRYSHDGFK